MEETIIDNQKSISFYLDSIKQIVTSFEDSLSENIEIFTEVSNLLIKSPKPLIISGTGTSGILAQKFAASLTSVGQSAIYLHPTEAMHGSLGRVPHSGTVVLLSNSGNTAELATLIKHLVRRSASIVSITGNPNSELAKNSEIHVTIDVSAESDPLGLVPTSSAIATLMACDQILCLVEILSEVDKSKFFENHPSGKLGSLSNLIFKNVMKKVDGHPAVIPTDSNMQSAINAISNGRMGACFLVKNNKLKSIFTDGDLRRYIEKNETFKLSQPVIEISSFPKITVREMDLVFEVLEKMESSSSKVTVFPVLDNNGEFTGIAHLHDILEKSL